MNPNSAIHQYNQYYPNIPLSREVLFTCNCRYFREELPFLPSHQRLCPIHKARAYRYIFTCADCGRIVYRKRWSPSACCKSCAPIRREVYWQLYKTGSFESDDDYVAASFQKIAIRFRISRERAEKIYRRAIEKLRKKQILKSIWKVINEPMDRERFYTPLTIWDL